MDCWQCDFCGNRVYLAAAIRSAYARTLPSNFVSAPPARSSANCRSKTIRTVWLNEVDTRARSRARRRGSVTVAQWDRLHVFTAPEGVAGGHGGALPLACPYSLDSGIEKKDDVSSREIEIGERYIAPHLSASASARGTKQYSTLTHGQTRRLQSPIHARQA